MVTHVDVLDRPPLSRIFGDFPEPKYLGDHGMMVSRLSLQRWMVSHIADFEQLAVPMEAGKIIGAEQLKELRRLADELYENIPVSGDEVVIAHISKYHDKVLKILGEEP